MSPARAASSDELSLRAWAAELEAAATIARQLAGTAFMPESLTRYHYDDNGRPLDGKDGRARRVDVDGTTATGAAAILTGKELGLKPMASLRSIAVINNTPALLAITLRAVLQNAGHDIWVADSNATRAVVRARRAGSDEVQESTWTIDRARQLGLFPGTERSNWRRQPQSMLVARATAEASRWISADALLGIPYIAEELIDELEGGGVPLAIEAADGDGQAPAARKRTTQRKTARAPAALPVAPPLPRAVPEEIIPPEEKITKPQLDRLHAALREAGMTDRRKALAEISGWAGRAITSTKDLTANETHAVLDHLEERRREAGQDSP